MKTIEEILAERPNTDPSQLVQYVGTVEAYDKWAGVYDTDGNFLQRLDTIEMRALLPIFLDRVHARFQAPAPAKSAARLTLLDLGCGTGRNTIQLLEALAQYQKQNQTDATSAPEVNIVGLDASPGMLEVAQSAIQSAVQRDDLKNSPEVSLGIIDLLQPATTRAQLPPALQSSGAAGVISTLVLEHIPAKEFFQAASATMLPGGYLLVTNMHADMGMRSQAGFTDPHTGIKIRPTSYCHSISEVLAAAEQTGFLVEDIVGQDGQNGVLERDVDERLVEKLGARAKKWVGIRVWFGICFSKKT
ncbi:methyltransferase [Penicillium canariense]|uniref:Methyltransferase n=1 Tax=Penicillium canariense TaxID=189055 RepID=A0A9W9I383_9EURO|nr:methyltransferase [Penicillium canariense]KAJ5167031.1 methyltransferase [Penicillium canariense]